MMIKKNLWVLEPESTEEIQAVNELLLNMREKQQREERIQFHKHSISSCVADAIGELGLGLAKRIVREINRELRDLK